MKQRNRAMDLEIRQVIEQLGLTSQEVTRFFDGMKEKYTKEKHDDTRQEDLKDNSHHS